MRTVTYCRARPWWFLLPCMIPCSDANHAVLMKWVMLMACVVLVHRDLIPLQVSDIRVTSAREPCTLLPVWQWGEQSPCWCSLTKLEFHLLFSSQRTINRKEKSASRKHLNVQMIHQKLTERSCESWKFP